MSVPNLCKPNHRENFTKFPKFKLLKFLCIAIIEKTTPKLSHFRANIQFNN